MSKKAGTGSKSSQASNRSILGITYVVAALFLGLAAYLGCFFQAKSEDIVNNSYSTRLDSFSDRIVGGRILASDGTVLVQTQMDSEENEARVYSFEDTLDHAAGYSTKGKTGIEALANFYLLTSHVNPMEQMGDELTGSKDPGGDVYTTLDTELRQAACTVLGARKGAVIAIEPDTDEVLAVVPKPGYGPNNLPGGWEALTAQKNKEDQLLDRTIRGLYPSGSTFEIATALEYMWEYPADYKNYQFDCGDVYEDGEYRIKCYHGTAHGHQDFTLAFTNSRNGVSASLGLEMGLGKRNSTARKFLFNGPFPSSGVPYKQSTYNMKPGAGTWEVLQTPIRQGTTQTTSLHNAIITAAIASGGTLMRFYFLDSAVSAGDETTRKLMPAAHGSLMNAGEVVRLTKSMRAVVTEGTGLAVHTGAYTTAAEIGSAKFETGRETHTWFAGFAPAESPRLMVMALVKEGGSGGKAAAPIARQLSDIYASC